MLNSKGVVFPLYLQAQWIILYLMQSRITAANHEIEISPEQGVKQRQWRGMMLYLEHGQANVVRRLRYDYFDVSFNTTTLRL